MSYLILAVFGVATAVFVTDGGDKPTPDHPSWVEKSVTATLVTVRDDTSAIFDLGDGRSIALSTDKALLDLIPRDEAVEVVGWTPPVDDFPSRIHGIRTSFKGTVRADFQDRVVFRPEDEELGVLVDVFVHPDAQAGFNRLRNAVGGDLKGYQLHVPSCWLKYGANHEGGGAFWLEALAPPRFLLRI